MRVATQPLNLSDELATAADMLFAPNAAFAGIIASPRFVLTLSFTLLLRLVDEVAKAVVRLPKIPISVFDIVWSTLQVGLIWFFWVTLVVFVATRWELKAGRSWNVCLAVGAHIAFVMVGAPAVIEFAIIAIQRILGIPSNLALMLPSIGWLVTGSLAFAFSNVTVFPIWGSLLAFFALRRLAAKMPSAIMFALLAAAGPVALYSATLFWFSVTYNCPKCHL